MSHIIFAFITTIFLTLFNNVMIGIKGNEINRIFMDIPISLIKANTLTNEDSFDNFSTYFDKDRLEESIKEYLNLSLKGKVDSYKLSFLYFVFNKDGEVEYDLSSYPKNVQIHFYCQFYKNFDIDKYLTFTTEKLF